MSCKTFIGAVNLAETRVGLHETEIVRVEGAQYASVEAHGLMYSVFPTSSRKSGSSDALRAIPAVPYYGNSITSIDGTGTEFIPFNH